MKKHVYFLGIAGKAMAPLAKMFVQMGWQVTGSDQENVFPPITTYLEENKISFAKGYNPDNIKVRPDLVVVGRSALLVDKKNPELQKAKKLGCPILSYPEVLRDFLVKENSVVVVGTYGKTTTTALVAWILKKAGLFPSFMIGGLPLNFPDGIRNTESFYSVVEGDETPAMEENDPPKFVLLTAAKWDHPEIFKSENGYIEAYRKFVGLIPSDGFLIVCREGQNTESVAKIAKCRVVWYSLEDKKADFYLGQVDYGGDLTTFAVVTSQGELELETSLLGKHNLQDIVGAIALCLNLGVKPEVIPKAVRSFKGVRERLENLGIFGGVTVFLDFAQHPAKVKESLQALRTRYKKNKIFCVFNPHASLLQQKESLKWYPSCFDQANQVVVTRVSFTSGDKKERVTGLDVVAAISKTNPNVFYEPVDRKVVDYLSGQAKRGDVIIFLSSGGLKTQSMIEQTISRLRQK